MFELNITTGQLAAIWMFAGLACMVPMFVKSPWQKFLIIPVVFFAIWVTFDINKEFIGTPMYTKPAKFIYKHHSTTNYDNQKWITLWSMVKNKDSLYRFVYDPTTNRELNKAKKQAEEGKATIGEFKKRKSKNKIDPTDKTDLVIYDFPYHKAFPKE